MHCHTCWQFLHKIEPSVASGKVFECKMVFMMSEQPNVQDQEDDKATVWVAELSEGHLTMSSTA